MRSIAFGTGLALMSVLAAPRVRGADVFGIKPDPRAVESGLYIGPVAPVARDAVAFTVTEPSGVARRRHPVRGAVPIYRGALKDPKSIRLIEGGREIPVQGIATGLWPEGTVKFLCLDFLTDLKAGFRHRARDEHRPRGVRGS